MIITWDFRLSLYLSTPLSLCPYCGNKYVYFSFTFLFFSFIVCVSRSRFAFSVIRDSFAKTESSRL